MRNFQVMWTDGFYSNKFGRELRSIQELRDEDTGERYNLSSYLNSEFKIPASYQVPCGYFFQKDQHGNIVDYIKFNQLIIFDKFGNLINKIKIDSLFNLYCDLEGARRNCWLGFATDFF